MKEETSEFMKRHLGFITHQVEDFNSVIADYKEFARILEAVLTQATRELGIIAIVQSRPKDPISFLNKCYKKQAEMDRKEIKWRRPFAHSFTDLCGARVIVEYRDQAEQVCAFIRSHFEIDERNSVNPKTALRSNEFAYRSDHLIVSLKPGEFTDGWAKIKGALADDKAREQLEQARQRLLERREAPEERHGAVLPPGPKYKAEIQVKTLLEHAWSNINHDRIYKGDITPPAELNREMNRVSALLEEADEVFARVVRLVDAYGTHSQKFLADKEHADELRRFEYAMEQAPDRVELAIRYAQLLAEKEQWTEVIDKLSPHVTNWQTGGHGTRFNQCYSQFNQNKDLVLKKRAEIEINQLREPRISTLLMEFGWAKWKRAGNDEAASRYARQLLEQAALLDNRNAEARIRRGRTYILKSKERLSHYETAFDIAPGDPGVLHEFLYTKLIHAGRLTELPLLRASLLEAIDNCRRRADIGIFLPDAFFHIGFFQMLLEQGQKKGPSAETVWSHPKVMQSLLSSLTAYVKAAELTSKESDLTDHYDRLRDLGNSLGADYPGSDWVERLLLVEFSAKAWIDARQQIDELEKDREKTIKDRKPVDDESLKQSVGKIVADASAKAVARSTKMSLQRLPKLESPIVIFVGGCGEAAQPIVVRFQTHIEKALQQFKGTVICGGTDAGISGIVGNARSTQPENVRKLAYVRSGLKERKKHTLIEKVSGTEGYELRYLEGDGFTPMEILEMWTDILADGINPADVIVLGINGGMLTAFELRLALSLGALVGVIRESGGAAQRILDDPDWKQHDRLLDIPDDVQTVKALIHANRAARSFAPDEREQAATKLHNESADKRRQRNMQPADRGWNELNPFFQRDVRERIAYWDVLLEAEGMRLFKLTEAPKGMAEVKEFTKDEIEMMAEMEHARWIVNRLSGGQRHGPEKKDGKTHPDIVPWRELSEKDKDKDREYVKQMLRANEFGYGVFRVGATKPATSP